MLTQQLGTCWAVGMAAVLSRVLTLDWDCLGVGYGYVEQGGLGVDGLISFVTAQLNQTIHYTNSSWVDK